MTKKDDEEKRPPKEMQAAIDSNIDQTIKAKASDLDLLKGAQRVFQAGKPFWDNVDPALLHSTASGNASISGNFGIRAEKGHIRAALRPFQSDFQA
jgi:hypothetical protein